MSEEEIINVLSNLFFDEYEWFLRGYDTQTKEEDKETIEKAIQGLLDLYQKEKEKNKELKEQLRKANEYIRNEMYIDDNPTICGDEEDTITELPISLNLYNEGLRELLELLEERN